MASLVDNSKALDFLAAPDLRRWFAHWLCAGWTNLCEDSLRPLSPKDYNRAFDRMEATMNRLANRLPKQSAAKQFLTVQRAAEKNGLNITLDAVLDELRRFLTGTPPTRPMKPRRKKSDSSSEWNCRMREWKRAVREWSLRRKGVRASPWFAERAQHKRFVETLGLKLCAGHYPDDPDCQFALRAAIRDFSAAAHIFPSGPDSKTVFEKGLLDDVKQCCKQPGSRKLAEFIVKHLRSGGQFQADGSESLRSIFRAITRCGDLKRALSRLKKYAATCSKRDSRKGWVRLRNALQAALDFVTAISSTPEMLRDFHLTHYQELQSSAWLGRPKKRLVHFQKLHAQENLHLTKALFKADERAGASAQKAAERA